MLEEKLREAALADGQTREQMIRELASHPDDILSLLIHSLQFGPKGGTERIATEVICAIGYPHNKSAIPVFINRIGDLNAPCRKEAIQALLAMDADVIVPSLIQILLDRGQHVQYWGEAANGICAMLADDKTHRRFVVPCGPVIAYLLSQQPLARDADLDCNYLLDVLQKIGKQCAVYALPVLIEVAQREETSELAMQARKLIASFDTSLLDFYQYVR